MAWWTGLDPSVQAAWIGVFGSLLGAILGAIVGGRVANRTAARVARQQWDRDEAVRHQDAMTEQFVDLLRSMRPLRVGKKIPRDIRVGLVTGVAIAGNLSVNSHPRLHDALVEVSDDLVADDRKANWRGVQSLLHLCLNYVQDPQYGVNSV